MQSSYYTTTPSDQFVRSELQKKQSISMISFQKKCKPIINGSVLPVVNFLTEKIIDYVSIERDEIISIIREINPIKATEPWWTSGRMLLLCDSTVVLPLQIMFRNILLTSIYPNTWKLADVTPIFKNWTNNKLKTTDQYLSYLW